MPVHEGAARSTQMTLAICLYAAIAVLSTDLGGQAARPDFDALRLQTGTFRYRTIVDGHEAGNSQIEVRAIGRSGQYRYSNLISGAFSQHWESIATAQFEPVSATLAFGSGADITPMFELAYKNGRVTGFALMRRQSPPARRAVDDEVSGDTVDQRIDWAAVMSLREYVAGQEIGFRVYDPESGHSRVSVSIGPTESTTVPAGTFETVRVTYRIDKNRGPETYVARVKRAIPRMLVQESFPNGSSTELIAIGH